MPFRSPSLPIAQFLGVNLRDGADLVANNEFTKAQNLYPKTKGMFYKREGSTVDIAPDEIPYCSEIIGLNRYVDPFGKRNTLIYCKNNGNILPDPTDGSIGSFALAGGASSGELAIGTYYIFFSYVGRGLETLVVHMRTLNNLTALNSYSLKYTGTLPSGIQSVNVYVGTIDVNSPQFFVGTLRTENDTVSLKQINGDATAATAEVAKPEWAVIEGNRRFKVTQGAGSLKEGTYYIACSWNHRQAPNASNLTAFLSSKAPNGDFIDEYLIVRVDKPNSSIQVCLKNGSGNDGYGSKYLDFWIGFKPPTEMPMHWVGQRKCRTTDPSPGDPEIMEIFGIIPGSNAQSVPTYEGDISIATVVGAFNVRLGIDHRAGQPATVAVDFIVKKDEDGALTEPMFSGSSILNLAWDPFLRTRDLTRPNSSDQKYSEVVIPDATSVSMQSFLGLCFIANGRNLLMQTDGFGLYETVSRLTTVQPGFPQYLQVLKSQLCAIVKNSDSFSAGAKNRNQVFGSNALDPYNWATGGTGGALRFVTIGDGFADGLTAMGVFGFNSATDGPNSFLATFKKSSTWVISNIPDPTSGVSGSANSLSGQTGCVAPSTVVATNIGLVFLGNDGDVYLILSTGGEPRRIGNRIRPALEHLAQNDELMKKATACFHKGFYKLSYPSSADSVTNDAEWWADLRTETGSPITWSGPHIGTTVGEQIVFSSDGDPDTRLGVVAGENATAILNDESTFEDLGEPVVSVLEWKNSRMKNMLNLKRYVGMLLDLYYDSQYAHSIMLEAFADDQYTQQNRTLSEGTAIWGASSFDQSIWGGAAFYPITVLFGPTNLVGRTFRWKLSHSSNAQLILAGTEIVYQPERRMIVQ